MSRSSQAGEKEKDLGVGLLDSLGAVVGGELEGHEEAREHEGRDVVRRVQGPHPVAPDVECEDQGLRLQPPLWQEHTTTREKR